MRRFRTLIFIALLLFQAQAWGTIQWANNASSLIANIGGISAGATSLTVTAGHGDRFPAVAAPHYFMVTLVDTSGNREIVKVSARTAASNTLTIVRAQEGTSARAFDQGSLVELRLTKHALDYLSKSADMGYNIYVADHSAADQGATTNDRSIKSLVDDITSAGIKAAIILPHTSSDAATEYVVSTDLEVGADIVLIIAQGAKLVPDNGITATMANPPRAGPYQVFDGDGTVTVTGYPQERAWWGDAQRLDLTGLTVGGAAGYPVPVGTLLSYAGSSAPTGWLLCYGQAVSRTTYAALFAVVSTTYGAGNGSTTFNVPDLRGRMTVGLDNMGGSAASRVAAATSLGTAAGAETHGHTGGAHTHTTQAHTLTVDEIPAHTHAVWNNSSGGGGDAGLNSAVVRYDGIRDSVTGSTGSGGSHSHGNTGSAGAVSTTTDNGMNPYMAVNYIIKY
jgi:microcystin-dependent protein